MVSCLASIQCMFDWWRLEVYVYLLQLEHGAEDQRELEMGSFTLTWPLLVQHNFKVSTFFPHLTF